MKMNSAQEKAVRHFKGPMMLLAGPGSGKTAVITGRTCRLVEQGVPAGAILVVTFTKAAAREMKERYLKRMNRPSTQVTFGTFHGVFYGILRNAYRLSGENILSEEQKQRLLKELVHTYCRDTEDEESEPGDRHCEKQPDPAGTFLFNGMPGRDFPYHIPYL